MKVSVCMAIHNGEKYLRQQIDSILPQLEHEDELIVSDDNSSDNSISIVTSYRDERIMLLTPNRLGSPLKNFGHALRFCSHPLIFLADQDDVWHEDKISVMKQALENTDLVVSDCRIVDEDLQELEHSFFQKNNSTTGLLRNFMKNSFIGCCMAFRKTVLEKAMPFPKGIRSHDQWIGLVAERYFKVAFIPAILVDHRRHQENYSSTGGPSENSLSEKIKLRFQLAKELCIK